MEMKCLAVQTFDARTKCYVSVLTYYTADHREICASSSQFSSQKLNS